MKFGSMLDNLREFLSIDEAPLIKRKNNQKGYGLSREDLIALGHTPNEVEGILAEQEYHSAKAITEIQNDTIHTAREENGTWEIES